jgi:hypothetical protein
MTRFATTDRFTSATRLSTVAVAVLCTAVPSLTGLARDAHAQRVARAEVLLTAGTAYSDNTIPRRPRPFRVSTTGVLGGFEIGRVAVHADYAHGAPSERANTLTDWSAGLSYYVVRWLAVDLSTHERMYGNPTQFRWRHTFAGVHTQLALAPRALFTFADLQHSLSGRATGASFGSASRGAFGVLYEPASGWLRARLAWQIEKSETGAGAGRDLIQRLEFGLGVGTR